MSIIFDQLRIADNGRKLYINIHVNNADYFKDIYLDSLTIMTADKVSETNPHEPTEDYIYKEVFEGNQKMADLDEHFVKSTFSDDLFFVFVKIKGVPDPCTPCTLDEEITVGATFDVKLLYQRVMDYTKAFADNCTVPVGFADFILLWNAFKAAIETEHYVPAIKYWNMLFGNYDERPSRDGSHSPFGSMGLSINRPLKTCGCHG